MEVKFCYLNSECISNNDLFRTQFRKQMNRADNDAAAKATDALINFETVKVIYPFFTNFPLIKVLFSILTMKNLKLKDMMKLWPSTS